MLDAFLSFICIAGVLFTHFRRNVGENVHPPLTKWLGVAVLPFTYALGGGGQWGGGADQCLFLGFWCVLSCMTLATAATARNARAQGIRVHSHSVGTSIPEVLFKVSEGTGKLIEALGWIVIALGLRAVGQPGLALCCVFGAIWIVIELAIVSRKERALGQDVEDALIEAEMRARMFDRHNHRGD